MGILDKIAAPADVQKLSKDETEQLCGEIRSFLVQSIAKTGGHLASNLGAVELTIALHRVYDTEKDRVVFDVGHQSYVHKLLTGRKAGFESLRAYGGMAGFPKPSESVHDAFIGGHASDAISIALGMARARTRRGENYAVAAVLGDGALTGGLAYEGLEDAGASGEPLVVVLNDNGMSITKNVGGIARYLSRLRLRPGYYRVKRAYRKLVKIIPGGGKLYAFTHRAKQKMKNMLLGCTMFEDMGFTYLGPVDGHDVDRLTYLLRYARQMNVPVLLHVITTKGRGYKYSEENPDAFHGVGAFNAENGRRACGGKTFSDVFGDTMCSLAAQDPGLCAVTAAMKTGTGLEEFAARFPRRFFDVGIAEGHAVSMAAGLAKQGMTPVVAVYSTFLQRSFDMLIHDVAILGLHVVFAVDRAGLVGEDGETHHGVFDTGYLRQVPGMTVYCPASFSELTSMIRLAVEKEKGPVAVRFPKGCEGCFDGDTAEQSALRLKKGQDITIAAYGTMINEALKAAQELEKYGVCAEVVKLNKIAPLDVSLICASAAATGALIVAEECMKDSALAGAIAAALCERNLAVKAAFLNLGDSFVQHGSLPELRRERGIDAAAIAAKTLELTGKEASHAG